MIPRASHLMVMLSLTVHRNCKNLGMMLSSHSQLIMEHSSLSSEKLLHYWQQDSMGQISWCELLGFNNTHGHSIVLCCYMCHAPRETAYLTCPLLSRHHHWPFTAWKMWLRADRYMPLSLLWKQHYLYSPSLFTTVLIKWWWSSCEKSEPSMSLYI